MKQLDLFYKAFTEYKQRTKSNLECVRFQHNSQSQNKLEQQSLKAIFATCTIDEDWVEAIEEGIPFILKAIKEERQFIRNDGEVLPIEKIKKTSKYSVQDLAKHSNYISREPNEDMAADIVPDKLLMIRKENDYAVYENRVVYATLLYLLEFVSSRLNIIKELTNKYEANSTISKKIIIGNRTLDFQLNLNEVIKNDPIAIKRNKYQDLINRIEMIYSNIVSLIRMPLMVEVSKVDVVSRPIVKTNVLKMDHNFKNTLKLFDFIAEYNKPGYTVTVEEKLFHPMEFSTIFDYTEVMMLYSFITYMYTNGLEPELKQNYQDELERLKELEKEKILERVKNLKIKAKMANKTIEEYLIVLDDACKILDDKNQKLQEKILEINAAHKKEIKELNEAHAEEIIKINNEHELYVKELNDVHEKEVNDLKEAHENEINALNEQHEQEINHLKDTHNTEINLLKETQALELIKYKQDYEEKLAEITIEYKDKEAQFLKAKEDYENDRKELKEAYAIKEANLNVVTNERIKEMQKEKETMEAEYLAMCVQVGQAPNIKDFTSEERFKALEREKKIMEELVDRAWKETKRELKKQIFSVKPTKKVRKKKIDESEEE